MTGVTTPLADVDTSAVEASREPPGLVGISCVFACLLALLVGAAAAQGGRLAQQGLLLVAVAAGGAAALYLLSHARATLLFSLAVVLQVFAGNWQYIGIPLGLDRLVLAAALLSVLRDLLPPLRSGAGAGVRVRVRVRVRPVYVVLLLLVLWTTASAWLTGSLSTRNGFFALLDRLGLVPFLLFVLAPRLYGTRQQRSVLLACLVGLGAYLGGTAVLEGVGLRSLVWPAYIADPSIGIHFERARGPFVEAAANGIALLICATASCVAATVWRSPTARALAALIGLACAIGTVFTLTRAVWLAGVVSVVAVSAITPALRRRLVPLALLGGTAVLALLVLVPGLFDTVSDRASSQRPIWDRYNTNLAAVRVVLDQPVIGMGWQRFEEAGAQYIRQSPDYPVTGAGIEVHNVFLSHAAELGLPGAALYLLAWAIAVGTPLRRRPSPEWQPWRRASLAVAVTWATVATFGPLSYPFANSALWLFAGIAGLGARKAAERTTP